MLVACLLLAGRSPLSIIHAKIAGNEGLCLGQDYLVFGWTRTPLLQQLVLEVVPRSIVTAVFILV
ncbi:MAG: hypothetical protein VW828_06300, partial [Candidatus Puniceispirillum sp.]